MGTMATDTRRQEHAGKDELTKWNWGAFLWGPIWALGHRLWVHGVVGLVLSFIPFVGLGVSVYFALKGNRWAWDRGGYSSHEELRAKERAWAWAALVFYGLLVALIVLAAATG